MNQTTLSIVRMVRWSIRRHLAAVFSNRLEVSWHNSWLVGQLAVASRRLGRCHLAPPAEWLAHVFVVATGASWRRVWSGILGIAIVNHLQLSACTLIRREYSSPVCLGQSNSCTAITQHINVAALGTRYQLSLIHSLCRRPCAVLRTEMI